MDADGVLKIVGAPEMKNHDKRVSDFHRSINMYCTGTVSVRNVLTDFVMKGLNEGPYILKSFWSKRDTRSDTLLP